MNPGIGARLAPGRGAAERRFGERFNNARAHMRTQWVDLGAVPDARTGVGCSAWLCSASSNGGYATQERFHSAAVLRLQLGGRNLTEAHMHGLIVVIMAILSAFGLR